MINRPFIDLSKTCIYSVEHYKEIEFVIRFQYLKCFGI